MSERRFLNNLAGLVRGIDQTRQLTKPQTVQLLLRRAWAEAVANSEDESQATLPRVREMGAVEIQTNAAKPLIRELVVCATTQGPCKGGACRGLRGQRGRRNLFAEVSSTELKFDKRIKFIFVDRVRWEENPGPDEPILEAVLDRRVPDARQGQHSQR